MYVYSIGSAIEQSMVTRGDFYGQGYVSIAKGVNTSIVWD